MSEFEHIYGKCAVTNNIHLLRHYKKTVLNCGPLWGYSLFGFESNIGVMKNFVCGPTDPLHQIAEKYLNWKSFPVYKKSLNVSSLLQPKTIVQSEQLKYVWRECGYSFAEQLNLKIYRCLKLNKMTYSSLESIITKSTDYFVKMEDTSIGKVWFYFEHLNEPHLLLKIYEQKSEKFHLKKVFETNVVKVYKCSQIIEKLLFFNVGLFEFITNEPNTYWRS